MNESLPLSTFAVTRSGDKGNHANLGVVALSEEAFHVLVVELTEARVKEFFQWTFTTRVERFLLPRVLAMNFVLYDALAGGASESLRLDTQGKLLGTYAADLPIPIPHELRSS